MAPADSSFPNPICIRCQACGEQRRGDLETILRDAGYLRRDAKPDSELMWGLLEGILPGWQCRKCGAQALRAEPDEWEDEGHGWLEAVKCQRCREPIPRERLEIFPDEVCCAACRERTNSAGDEPSYCSFCGSVTQWRAASRGGLTRYVEYCPNCASSGR